MVGGAWASMWRQVIAAGRRSNSSLGPRRTGMGTTHRRSSRWRSTLTDLFWESRIVGWIDEPAVPVHGRAKTPERPLLPAGAALRPVDRTILVARRAVRVQRVLTLTL